MRTHGIWKNEHDQRVIPNCQLEAGVWKVIGRWDRYQRASARDAAFVA